MAGKTEAELDLKIKSVQDLLDSPAAEYLKQETITTMLSRAFLIVDYQTTIDDSNVNLVKQVIYAIAAWHSFGAYLNTMGDNLQDTAKFEFLAKLKHLKEIAIGLGNMLFIDVTGEKIEIDSYEVISGGTGISNLKDTDYFEGAADVTS